MIDVRKLAASTLVAGAVVAGLAGQAQAATVVPVVKASGATVTVAKVHPVTPGTTTWAIRTPAGITLSTDSGQAPKGLDGGSTWAGPDAGLVTTYKVVVDTHGVRWTKKA